MSRAGYAPVMILGQRLIVVLPAYNAARTLARTVAAIPPGVVDQLLLVDDCSRDGTVACAQQLGIPVTVHPVNRGYGGNQKTCYRLALAAGADVVVMLHPDDQYSPRLVPAMAAMVAGGEYDLALGSRMLAQHPLSGGMPRYKHLSNRLLTRVQNRLLGQHLSEYHTGFRAYRRAALERIPFGQNGDGFLFDNQLLVQAICLGLRIGELSCPTRYPPDASSISFARSVEYGVGVLGCSVAGWRHRRGLGTAAFLKPGGAAP